MTVFFILGCIVSLLARILFGALVDKVSIFDKLLTPLTCISFGFGILAAVFIAIKIYNEVKRK